MVKKARSEAPPITLALARHALTYQPHSLPPDIIQRAKQCMLDWFGVTIAALDDPVHLSLTQGLVGQENGEASIVGRAGHYTAGQAALVNAATAHALDYDDVNLAISGHPTAVIFAAVLALAEKESSGGLEVIAAFVAGYETACRVGALVCPDHLNRGFHATGTVSIFGAAVACAHLLKFDEHGIAAAMGIAGTQASGLKAMFGTMVKPLHAGFAARGGLEAALFVSQGFDSREDILEATMGFAATHSSDYNSDAALDTQTLHLRNNLFKYEVSCYGTHAAIECVKQIQKAHGIRAADIDAVLVRADRSISSICNLQHPTTGMQGKFSIRLNTAMALLGIDTGKADSYTDSITTMDTTVAMRDKVTVELLDGWPAMQSEVTVRTTSGQRYSHTFDAGVANPDPVDQHMRLTEKFYSLTEAVLGVEPAQALFEDIQQIEKMADISGLARYCVLPRNGHIQCVTERI